MLVDFNVQRRPYSLLTDFLAVVVSRPLDLRSIVPSMFLISVTINNSPHKATENETLYSLLMQVLFMMVTIVFVPALEQGV